jgi:hypothetical protein
MAVLPGLAALLRAICSGPQVARLAPDGRLKVVDRSPPGHQPKPFSGLFAVSERRLLPAKGFLPRHLSVDACGDAAYFGCCAASCSRTAVSTCFWFLAASFAAFAFSVAAFSSCFCCRFCAFISDLVIGAVVASLVCVVEDVPVEGAVLVVVVIDVCAFVWRGCSTKRPSKQLKAANLE